jgi:uncharacterized protein YbaP (TraB family)
MKKLFSIFLLIFPGLTWAQNIVPENELLWEISGNGLKEKSYLFGSLHSNDKRLFRLSDSTYFALDKSKAIVLEADIFSLFPEWDTRKEQVTLLFDNKGKPYTGSARSTKTIYGDEDGMPQFLDAYFQEYCYNAGKVFFPLESVEDQINIFADAIVPDASGVNFAAAQILQDKMMDIYLKGDIRSLDKIMRVNLSPFPGSYEQLIVDRNVLMVKGLDSLMRKQGLFCAVGAGHLSGEKGIIQLLRKQGYKLRKVTASFNEVPIAEKKKVRETRTYTYLNDEVGLLATFPGKPVEKKIGAGNTFLLYREMGQGNTYSIELIPIDGTLSLKDQADIHIASPDATYYNFKLMDDETEIYEGISDTYTEGMHWVRVMQNDRYLVVMKAYGGNKFMNSNRPSYFFSKVWFE